VVVIVGWCIKKEFKEQLKSSSGYIIVVDRGNDLFYFRRLVLCLCRRYWESPSKGRPRRKIKQTQMKEWKGRQHTQYEKRILKERKEGKVGRMVN
jgi:hypothetical protein